MLLSEILTPIKNISEPGVLRAIWTLGGNLQKCHQHVFMEATELAHLVSRRVCNIKGTLMQI